VRGLRGRRHNRLLLKGLAVCPEMRRQVCQTSLTALADRFPIAFRRSNLRSNHLESLAFSQQAVLLRYKSHPLISGGIE
jgi:hypothetical protein